MMDSFTKTLRVENKEYTIYSLKKIPGIDPLQIAILPRSLKILLENLLRHKEKTDKTLDGIEAIINSVHKGSSRKEIAYHPARVIMQDFTGVPALVDLAAMREAVTKLSKDSDVINPQIPVDLVIDHSLQVEHFGNREALEKNIQIEYERNTERYKFLKWGEKVFSNLKVVPPGMGIIHQINLEYLARIVCVKSQGKKLLAYPDTCVGTDSHTTMINALSVLGWGVGGIEAEAALLGQPVTMLIPEVVGCHLTGELQEGISATDLVLHIVELLRKHSVVGKFVEFFGEGVRHLSLADRATLANMAPEYGATCGFFPTDEKTIEYLKLSGRDDQMVKLVEAYAKEQGLWSFAGEESPLFASSVELNLDRIQPCIAGPKRPQDKILLKEASQIFLKTYHPIEKEYDIPGENFKMKQGHIVVAAITSCTNTSNPSVLIAAGLLARKARMRGMKTMPWVKTSLAPGSQVVSDYLEQSHLQDDFDALGFYVVGYGCTTCIGNTGPLAKGITSCIEKNNLLAVSVLSGNRNFEGRISPHVKANYLASPPLVVAYSLVGSMTVDLTRDSLGKDLNNQDVFLKDIWPTNGEINAIVEKIDSSLYKKRYQSIFDGDKHWQKIDDLSQKIFKWNPSSTYIRKPNFFTNITEKPKDHFEVHKASILAILGDSVTTDHISPAGDIPLDSPAGLYLKKNGIQKYDFNSYGSRRGNHEVMTRGTFANIRIRNEMLGGEQGGNTLLMPEGKKMSIYEASLRYAEMKISLVIIAGREYGTGSSRDWAAKGTALLGVKAVIVESFERIHRSNLIGMGVFPLEFAKGVNRLTLGLIGKEKISLVPKGKLAPKMHFEMICERLNGEKVACELIARIDTKDEMKYFQHGGILHYVLREFYNDDQNL